MEIENEDQEAPKEMVLSSPQLSTFQTESSNPIDPIDPVRQFDVVVHRNKPTWARQTLQDEKGHASPRGFSQREGFDDIFFVVNSLIQFMSDSR